MASSSSSGDVDAIVAYRSSEEGGGTPKVAASNPMHPPHEAKEKPKIHFNRPKIGIKARLVLDSIDDLTEEYVLDVTFAYHFEHSSLVKTVARGERTVTRWASVEELYESHSSDSEFVCPRVELADYRSLDLKKEFILEYFTLGRITIIREYRVVLKGSFKLDRFPFDRQIVRLELETFSAIMCHWSVPLEESPPIIAQNEVWKSHMVVVECIDSCWKVGESGGGVEIKLSNSQDKATYQVSFGISRSSNYYLLNFGVVIFLLVELGSFVIAIHPSDFPARSSYVLTLLLTLVAFRFTMTSLVPKKSYLTWLDYYSLLAIAFILLIIVESFCVSAEFYPISDDDPYGQVTHKFDLAFILIVNIAWPGFHLYIVLAKHFFPNHLYESWDAIRAHLEVGGKGVRQIITSRNEDLDDGGEVLGER